MGSAHRCATRPTGACDTGHNVPALDGIRATAAGRVVVHHLLLGGPTGGFIGVPIFFVLSGFLITSLLLSEFARSSAILFRRFWRRRIYRLYPALVAGALVAVPLAAVTKTPSQWRLAWTRPSPRSTSRTSSSGSSRPEAFRC